MLTTAPAQEGEPWGNRQQSEQHTLHSSDNCSCLSQKQANMLGASAQAVLTLMVWEGINRVEVGRGGVGKGGVPAGAVTTYKG